MTSKEAIQEIEKIARYLGKSGAIDIEDELMRNMQIIEKDLEILELLKKLPFEIYQNGGGDDWNWFVDTKQSFKITEEEAIKIKGWLENV